MNKELERTISRWIEDASPSEGRHTERAYEKTITRFLAGKTLSKLTLGDVLAYSDSPIDQGLSKATRAARLSAISSFLKYAASRGLVPPIDLTAARVKRNGNGASTERILTVDEARRLQEAAKKIGRGKAVGPAPAYVAIRTLLLTGLRVSELTGARSGDFERDADGDTSLQDWRRSRGFSDGDPVLPYSDNGVLRLVRKAANKAGIDKKVSPHWLRHSFVTCALAGGALGVEVQWIAGNLEPSRVCLA